MLMLTFFPDGAVTTLLFLMLATRAMPPAKGSVIKSSGMIFRTSALSDRESPNTCAILNKCYSKKVERVEKPHTANLPLRIS